MQEHLTVKRSYRKPDGDLATILHAWDTEGDFQIIRHETDGRNYAGSHINKQQVTARMHITIVYKGGMATVSFTGPNHGIGYEKPQPAPKQTSLYDCTTLDEMDELVGDGDPADFL